MNLSLRQLKAFIGVAQNGNFTKAAQKLHISQAALSASIQELEAQLRFRLFERTRRSVRLTDAGECFLPTAIEVVRALTTEQARILGQERAGTSHFRLGFTPLVAVHLVPAVLERLRVQHPDCTVDLVDASPRELQVLVDLGDLDAAFGTFFEPASGIARTPLFGCTLQVTSAIAAPGRRRTTTWADLESVPLIALPPESPLQQKISLAFDEAGVKPRQAMVVNQLETMVALAGKGLGVAIVPSFARAACELHGVHTQDVSPKVAFDFYRIERMGQQTPPLLKAISDMLDQVVHAGRRPRARVSDNEAKTQQPTRRGGQAAPTGQA